MCWESYSKQRNKKEGRSQIRPSRYVLAYPQSVPTLSPVFPEVGTREVFVPNLSPVIQNLWDFVPSSE